MIYLCFGGAFFFVLFSWVCVFVASGPQQANPFLLCFWGLFFFGGGCFFLCVFVVLGSFCMVLGFQDQKTRQTRKRKEKLKSNKNSWFFSVFWHSLVGDVSETRNRNKNNPKLKKRRLSQHFFFLLPFLFSFFSFCFASKTKRQKERGRSKEEERAITKEKEKRQKEEKEKNSK